MTLKKYILIILVIFSTFGSISTTITSNAVTSTINKSESSNATCTNVVYDSFCPYITGLHLTLGDQISWSFSGTNSYVGIQVWAMDNYNYGLFSYNYTGVGYLLSNGSYYVASGTWNVTYNDVNWHIVFWNLDSDSLNYGYSTQLTVTVTGHDLTSPNVYVNSPTPGSIVTGVVPLLVTSTDFNNVSYTQGKIDNNPYNVIPTSPNFWYWNTTALSEGLHYITIQAYDTFGNIKTIQVNFTVHNNLPSISIISPTFNEIVNGNVTIKVSASSSIGLSVVRYKVDTGPYIDNTSLDYEWFYNTSSLTEDYHLIYVDAVDTLGFDSLVYKQIIVDRTAPTLTITAPNNAATVSGIITLSATATDNWGIAYVAYNIDGGNWVKDTTYDYSFTLDTTTLTNGQHTINFISVDNGNNTKTKSITIKVNNYIPSSGSTTSNSGQTTSVNSQTETTTKKSGINTNSAPGFEIIPLFLSFGFVSLLMRRKLKK